MNTKKAAPEDFTEGRIHLVTCGNPGLQLENGLYQNVIIIANCKISFVGGQFENAIVVSTSTHADAMKSSSANGGVRLGAVDNCDEGGGTIFLSHGGVDFSAGMEMHGSQIIAAKGVQFAANADGIRGASIVSGGRIDGTSNMEFAFCGGGMGHVFQAEYFRLAG